MRALILWLCVAFGVFIAFDRFDLLHNIGAATRHGVDAIKDGYNGDGR